MVRLLLQMRSSLEEDAEHGIKMEVLSSSLADVPHAADIGNIPTVAWKISKHVAVGLVSSNLTTL